MNICSFCLQEGGSWTVSLRPTHPTTMSAKPETTAKEKAANQAAERKTLDLALSAINKQYGDGTLMRMGDATKMQVSSVSTGSVAIDLALGVGGLPRGRIVEIFGPESSGKTTLCLLYTSPSPRD